MKPLLLLLLAAGPALANDAAFVKCRSVPDATQRLACYDAVPMAAPSAMPVAAPRAAAPVAAVAVAAATPTRAQAEQAFGLPEKAGPVDSIQSTIPGKFEGWEPRQEFTLANGQVWRIADDSSAYHLGNNVKVTIEKKTFTNYMTIEGMNQKPNVRRVR